MGKHKKTPRAEAKPHGLTSGSAMRNADGSLTGLSAPDTTANDVSPLADVEDGLREAFAAARAMAANGDAPIQVLRELGGLGRAITTVQAERRAQAKAREHTARTLPPELVMEHLRSVSADQRAHYRREMDAMDNTESVLG